MRSFDPHENIGPDLDQNHLTLNWFSTYLEHKRQQMSINDNKSDLKTVTFGAPQGSILGPLLFLLFINDLPHYVNDVSADLDEDDTVLYDVQNSVEMIEHNLQTGLNQLHIWCKSNEMVLYSAKTKVMLITTCQK